MDRFQSYGDRILFKALSKSPETGGECMQCGLEIVGAVFRPAASQVYCGPCIDEILERMSVGNAQNNQVSKPRSLA